MFHRQLVMKMEMSFIFTLQVMMHHLLNIWTGIVSFMRDSRFENPIDSNEDNIYNLNVMHQMDHFNNIIQNLHKF
jgi:hypothetical protein